MKSRRARIFLSVALCLAEGRAFADQPDIPACENDSACLSLYDRAKEESGRNNLTEALRLYKLTYEVRADPHLLFSIARVLHKLEKKPEAVTYYRQFIDSPLDDAEQKRKAQQYIEQAESVVPLPPKASPALESHSERAVAKRPRWRFIAGGAAIGAGLVLVGFGGSALSAQGKCVTTPIRPAETCDNLYATTPVGGALVGTGAAVVVGGVILMAWPGR